MQPKYLLPVVECKICQTPPTRVLLPYPNPPEISLGQPLWPTADWKAYVACHECGLVYEYYALDVRWAAFSMSFLNQLRQRPSFFAIDVIWLSRGIHKERMPRGGACAHPTVVKAV